MFQVLLIYLKVSNKFIPTFDLTLYELPINKKEEREIFWKYMNFTGNLILFLRNKAPILFHPTLSMQLAQNLLQDVMEWYTKLRCFICFQMETVAFHKWPQINWWQIIVDLFCNVYKLSTTDFSILNCQSYLIVLTFRRLGDYIYKHMFIYINVCIYKLFGTQGIILGYFGSLTNVS